MDYQRHGNLEYAINEENKTIYMKGEVDVLIEFITSLRKETRPDLLDYPFKNEMEGYRTKIREQLERIAKHGSPEFDLDEIVGNDPNMNYTFGLHRVYTQTDIPEEDELAPTLHVLYRANNCGDEEERTKGNFSLIKETFRTVLENYFT